MRLEASPRHYSLRIYAEHPTDYVASCQVLRYGDRAIMYSIIGSGFYAAAGLILEWAADQGFRMLEGYVSPAHARLLRRIAAQTFGWTLHVQGSGRFDGHELTWVILERTH